MDRLDTWLNAQRGWRLYGLLCLYTLPLTLMLSVIGNNIRGLFSVAAPTPSSVAEAAAVGTPGALVIAGLMLWLHPRAVRNARKRNQRPVPLLPWRAFAYLVLFSIGMTISLLSESESAQWHQRYGKEAFLISVCLLAASFAFLIWHLLYARRLTKPEA